MFFELRQYRIKDGKRDQWVRFMEDKVIPFQVERGMVIVDRPKMVVTRISATPKSVLR
jgi:hypothetical protein